MVFSPEIKSTQQTIAGEVKSSPVRDGVVYSKKRNHQLFSTPPLQAYAEILPSGKIQRLLEVSDRLWGTKLLELNATAQGGGVAEMLYSSVPFLNMLGIETEWKIISGTDEFFEYTKNLHNLLQGKKGEVSAQMRQTYCDTIKECAAANLIESDHDVIMVNDPQPFGLARYVRNGHGTWLWRCHIDIAETSAAGNGSLWEFMNSWIDHYDVAIYSTPQYVVSGWALPSFIIPPFIDPLSEKNRDLSQAEIDETLDKYGIDSSVPIIAQIGRFDPWKGLDRTIEAFRLVRKQRRCQLILAGGMASDDPEGERMFDGIREQTANDEDIHVLSLCLDDRIENWKEVNALQRAATVLMAPSTKEGFGLVITEAMWKAKPIIASNVGGISLQVKDGDTGYFYDTAPDTAKRIVNLLDNPAEAEALGTKAKAHVAQNFLMPDRLADYLMTIEMATRQNQSGGLHRDSVISFRPWYKLG